MANVYLGPVGGGIVAEILPVVKYVGAAPDYPVTIDPQTDEATMSDKSRRLAFFDNVEDFGIGWGYLTLGQLDTLKALVALHQILKYRNDFVDNTEYDVYISSFSYEPVFSGMRVYKDNSRYFKVDMTLREA